MIREIWSKVLNHFDRKPKKEYKEIKLDPIKKPRKVISRRSHKTKGAFGNPNDH